MNLPQGIIITSPTGNVALASVIVKGNRITVDLGYLGWHHDPAVEDVTFANNTVMEVLRMMNPDDVMEMSGTAVAADTNTSDRMTRDWLQTGTLPRERN